jgi:hypothetical protein
VARPLARVAAPGIDLLLPPRDDRVAVGVAIVPCGVVRRAGGQATAGSMF